MAFDPHRPPYELPLDRDALRSALAHGHGRALEHVRSHTGDVERELVLDAALHWRGHDYQVEPSRDRWLCDLLEATGCVDDFLRSIDDEGDGDSLDQRAFVVARLVKRGRADLRPLLESRLRCEHPHGEDWIHEHSGIEALAQFDDDDALVKVVEFFQRHDAASGNDASLFDIYTYVDRYGEDALLERLRSLRARSEGVDAWLSSLENGANADTVGGARRGRRGPTVEKAVRLVKENRQRVHRWARFWQDDEVERFARAFEEEPDRSLDPRYLRVLMTSLPERLVGRALDAARTSEYEDERAVYEAFAAHPDLPSVREHCLARLDRDGVRAGAIRPLAASLRANDVDLLLGALLGYLESPDLDDAERFYPLWDVSDALEESDMPEALPLLVLHYERTPCTHCRELTVLALLRRGDIPDWIDREERSSAVPADRAKPSS